MHKSAQSNIGRALCAPSFCAALFPLTSWPNSTSLRLLTAGDHDTLERKVPSVPVVRTLVVGMSMGRGVHGDGRRRRRSHSPQYVHQSQLSTSLLRSLVYQHQVSDYFKTALSPTPAPARCHASKWQEIYPGRKWYGLAMHLVVETFANQMTLCCSQPIGNRNHANAAVVIM